MGLAVLPYVETLIEARKKIVMFYNENLNFSKLNTIKIRENVNWNYSYYPVVFESEEKLLEVQTVLNENEIFPRRYFYPSLNTIDYVRGEKMPISESLSSRVMCLPLYKRIAREIP